jgi:alkylation response protein AidB-like acyl-CoA dehydrogenase
VSTKPGSDRPRGRTCSRGLPLVLRGLEETRRTSGDEALVRDLSDPQRSVREIYDIFEGTEQIQQLVIARAISGLRIE